jgi:adenine-specific DNA-methyltransferase
MGEQRAPRLELTWPNKDKFLLVPKDDQGKPIWVGRDHPAAHEVRLTTFTDTVGEVGQDPHADNLLFTGDSLDVLRILREVPEFATHYRGRVKLIYIDPPFNTGQTFTHYDDWMEHSTWLSFMRDRLLLAKDLLAPDGSIWVHLDDAEQHRMRCLLDEVFGAQNFIATIAWQKSDSPRNSARHLSVDQDYIHIFARDAEVWRPRRLPRTDAADAIYRNPDGDLRGPWLPSDPYANKPYALGTFSIVGRTGRTFSPPPGKYWRVSEARLRELDADGRVWWGPDGSARPSIKRYLSEVGDLVPRTMWSHAEVGSNRTSSREMKGLFPDGTPFSTPKPERLMERVVLIGSSPGDIVLDCFAGSGTTAAVAHKHGRRWVTAELLAETANDFTKPRMTKVVEGQDPGGITSSTGWKGGGGFRALTVEPSLYEVGPGGVVLLREGVSDRELAEAMCGQLGFTYTPDQAPFAGRRGRMRVAVLDGFVGPEEARHLVYLLGDGERVTIAATAVLPGVEDLLTELARGSRVRKIPRDVLREVPRRRPALVEGGVL